MDPSVAGFALFVWLGQLASAAPDLPVSVDRIQQELAKRAPARLQLPLVFRLTVEGRPPRLKAPWDPANDTIIPGWVRPQMPIYHYEYLMAVTPEAFRSGVLFQVSISKLLEPLAARLADEIREAWQRRREARARQEVDEALRQLLEARKKQERK
jgi:hypothetical protein